jgi:hypothetical protein
MKKIVLLFTLAFCGYLAQAQLILRPTVGLNSNTFTTNLQDADFKSQLGYIVGLDMQIGNKVYFQPGLFWEGKNTKIEPRSVADFDYRVNGVRIPLLVGYRLNQDAEQALGLRLFTGPDLFFVANVRPGENVFVGALPDKDDFRSLNWGWSVGAGLDLLFLFVDFGYEFGLNQIFKQEFNNDSRNNLFFLTGGIRIRI